MDFLLSHWHCILPVIAIAAGMILMREKPDKKRDGDRHPPETQTVQNDKQ